MKQTVNNGRACAISYNEVVPLQTNAQNQLLWAMEHQINEELYAKGLISIEMYRAAKASLEMEQSGKGEMLRDGYPKS